MAATSDAETTREGLFTSTRWTMVLDAGESQTPPEQALNALSELCRIYWRPIFLFLRRQGSNPDDAQDLTQGFFAHLIESRAYARADPDKGQFLTKKCRFGWGGRSRRCAAMWLGCGRDIARFCGRKWVAPWRTRPRLTRSCDIFAKYWRRPINAGTGD